MNDRMDGSALATASTLEEQYLRVRNFTERLCDPLSPEDCTIQSMPDASPARWHMAHTTWFFETFLLDKLGDYKPYDPSYRHLFNSYYNAVGKQFPRPRRGLLSRPGHGEVLAYRQYVDEHMLELLGKADRWPDGFSRVVEVGLHHEQQHQELILTDIKHVLSCNPLRPAYRDGIFATSDGEFPQESQSFDEGVYWIGHDGDGFAFDNESPKHRLFLNSFAISNRLVTCGEYIDFIEDGGYRRPDMWLSLGWQAVNEGEWDAPLYWLQRKGTWCHFTLTGMKDIQPDLPVCHLSYFEADAFARWAGQRLPSEGEWELAAKPSAPAEGFVDSLLDGDFAIHPQGHHLGGTASNQFYGHVWEWTASPYSAYPGYRAAAGALGEYNGKFMCNQFVLRGGSCATSSDHIRGSYRNFFPPEARWQFSGLRLAWDI